MKNGIYIDSMHYGPEDIQTSISYFIFGDVLIKSNQPEKGYSFYNQAIKIWYKFFKNLMRNSDSESSEVDETIIKQGLSQLKGAEALFLDRLRNENEEEVIDDLHRLNYALAFIHRYVGEEDVALEYCRNVDGYLIGKYPQGHAKIDRFYNMFPHYRENAPREEEEEEDEDVSQDESGQEESANRYENGGFRGEDDGQYEGQGEYQGEEEDQGEEGEGDEGEGEYEGQGQGQGEEEGQDQGEYEGQDQGEYQGQEEGEDQGQNGQEEEEYQQGAEEAQEEGGQEEGGQEEAGQEEAGQEEEGGQVEGGQEEVQGEVEPEGQNEVSEDR